jgi:hypothetical protein
MINPSGLSTELSKRHKSVERSKPPRPSAIRPGLQPGQQPASGLGSYTRANGSGLSFRPGGSTSGGWPLARGLRGGRNLGASVISPGGGMLFRLGGAAGLVGPITTLSGMSELSVVPSMLCSLRRLWRAAARSHLAQNWRIRSARRGAGAQARGLSGWSGAS